MKLLYAQTISLTKTSGNSYTEHMKSSVMHVGLLALVVTILMLSHVQPAQAKLLPRFAGSNAAANQTPRSYSSVIITPRFMPARNGLRVSFAGLSNATNVTYILSYETNGKPEGVQGSINPSEGSTTRELLFGTCSTGVCVSHLDIKNMTLEIRSELTIGKTSIKRYRIRV